MALSCRFNLIFSKKIVKIESEKAIKCGKSLDNSS